MTPDFTWLFIKMLSGLILVLVLAFVLIRFILPRTRLGRGRATTWIRLIDRVALDPHFNAYLVKVMDRYLILGKTEQSVRVLTELSSTEGQKLEEEKQ